MSLDREVPGSHVQIHPFFEYSRIFDENLRFFQKIFLLKESAKKVTSYCMIHTVPTNSI